MNANPTMTANRTLLGALGALGIGVALLTIGPRRVRSSRSTEDRRRAFVAYLRDHLTGSDAVTHVVHQLAQSHRDASERAVFSALYDQLEAERDVVRALLADLGASSRSIKRLAGHAAGLALRGADGTPGDLSLFRALEGIAVGIQGKRCLWRAAQALSPTVRPRGPRSFTDLEADAVKQWEAVERLRLSYVPRTFSP